MLFRVVQSSMKIAERMGTIRNHNQREKDADSESKSSIGCTALLPFAI